jgi:hypothetical protein
MARVTLRRSLNVGLALGALSLGARFLLPALGAASMAPMEACSVTATDGGLLIKPQTKYTGQTIQKGVSPWSGQPIVITSGNGDITVTGDSNATGVTVNFTPFAFADGDKPQDGTDAINDVTSRFQVGLDDKGQIRIACSQAAQQHNSAGIGTTGCTLAITVPAGSATQGVALTAHTDNGEVKGSTLYSAAGTQIQLTTGNGNADGEGITGSVNVQSTGAGDAIASVTPTQGAVIQVSANTGDATLSLPKSFATDKLVLLAAGNGAVTINGLPMVTQATTSVGAAGTGASSVTVQTTELGNVTLNGT